MKKRIFVVFVVILLLLSFVNSYADDAKASAMNAYFSMEESPFDRDVFEKSVLLIKSAHKTDPSEPWIYVALSLAAMQSGYRKGSWYSFRSFEEGAVEKAYELAERAKELGSNESQAHAHLARVFIVKKEYRKAWDLLNRAYQLDEDNFYVWFYKALIHYYMEGYDDATSHLNEAEGRISQRYQKKLVTRQRQRIARKLGDKVLEEDMYKKNISDFPENAYMYGNYASFLLRNKRYKEAVVFYEKAIAIKPYRQAREKLEEAKDKAGTE